MESPINEKPLLTISDVLARCVNSGRPLASSTFRTYVAKGKAPRPAGKQGNQPLWRESEIKTWLKNYADTRDEVEIIHAPQKVRLHSEHGVELDPDISEHAAMKRAEQELQEQITALESAVSLRQSHLDDLEERKDKALTEDHVDVGFIARLIKNHDSQRRARTLQNWLELRQSEYQEIQQALLAAKHDLRVVQKWNEELLTWAKYQEKEREEMALQAAFAQEQAKSVLSLDNALSVAEFVLEKPERLSFAYEVGGSGHAPREEVLQALREQGTYGAKVVLDGADFGYRYHLDATDRGEYMDDGQWRVSWTGNFKTEGELYAELFFPQEEPLVLFIGPVPETTLRKMIDWLIPFERRQRERNSLGLIAKAYQEQKEAGFPALTNTRER